MQETIVKISELLLLSMMLENVKSRKFYDVIIANSGDSIVVHKIINDEHVDTAVSSLCDVGAEYLIEWIENQERENAE